MYLHRVVNEYFHIEHITRIDANNPDKWKVYFTDGNFVSLSAEQTIELKDYMLEKNIIIRDPNSAPS